MNKHTTSKASHLDGLNDRNLKLKVADKWRCTFVYMPALNISRDSFPVYTYSLTCTETIAVANVCSEICRYVLALSHPSLTPAKLCGGPYTILQIRRDK
jgi:hypothetical protein